MRSVLKQRQRVFPHVPFGHSLETSPQPANSSHQQPKTAENTPIEGHGTTNTVHNNIISWSGGGMNAAQKACSVTKNIKLKPFKKLRLKSCTKLIVSTSVKSRNLTEIYKMEGSLSGFPQVVVHFRSRFHLVMGSAVVMELQLAWQKPLWPRGMEINN